MEKPSFFEMFAKIAAYSNLTNSEIARRTNEFCAGTIFEHLPPVHRATVGRILQHADLPSPVLLYRIARFGLDQNEMQCHALERLRQWESITHTTSHHKVTKVPTTDELHRPHPNQALCFQGKKTDM